MWRPPPKKRPAALRRFLAGLCLVSCTHASWAAQTVQSLRYGNALFHFYQRDYFNALTELMVAGEIGELGVHAGDAELLRGGMSLSYGMDAQAQAIFERYLADESITVNRDRAWFYLAKMAWQRGELERCEAALDKVGQLETPALEQELNYLRSQLSILRGKPGQAGEYLARLPANSPWLPYHYYNMGAAAAADGRWPEAAAYFENFQRLDIATEEARSLRDRANAASGFAAIAMADYARASRDFQQVRLHSPMAERALLGYGWAAGEQLGFQAALGPWQELGSRDPAGASVRESLLAIPYAWEQLGRQGTALRSYQDAAGVFESELKRVGAAIDLFSKGDMATLLQLRRQATDSWLAGSDILPRSAAAPWLGHLVSSHAFQRAMKELRDLHRIDARMKAAAQRLQLLAHVDAEQQHNWRLLAQQNREQRLQRRYDQLQGRLAHLRERLAAARREKSGRSLADAGQLELWNRWERAAGIAASLAPDPERAFRLRLLRGLLLWDDSERYHQRLWIAERSAAEVEQLALDASAALGSLSATIARSGHSGFEARIIALQERLAGQHQRALLAMNNSTENLRAVAVAQLQSQAREIARSLARSKLAIARLYDAGSTGGQL